MRKLVKRKSDNSVTHFFGNTETVTLDSNGLTTARFTAPNMSLSEFELVAPVPAPPSRFIGNLMMFDGSWSIPDQAAYDAQIAADLKADVPHSVTSFQAVTQLEKDNKQGLVVAFLAQPGNEEAKIAYERKPRFERDSAFIALLAPAINLSDDDVDQLFINADQIK